MDFSQQFQFCSFCKTSHKQGSSHIYTKKHQHVIDRILQKFTLKIKSAKMSLDDPDVTDIGFESEAQFWCNFCVAVFKKHLDLDVCTIKFGGILEHIAENSHRSSVFRFLRNHRIDEKKQRSKQFFLSLEDLQKFKLAAELKIRKYEERKKQSLQKESQYIAEVEQRRKSVFHSTFLESDDDRNKEKVEIEKTVAQSQMISNPGTQRIATLTAHGEGLTFIGTQNFNEGEGNIHTNALPPWLQWDNDQAKRSEIGPSMEDYSKHLDREKSRKLPAGRVGAKYDRSDATSPQWLPSFGRVWNKGSRQQSQNFFRKEMRQLKTSNIFTKPQTITRQTEDSASEPQPFLEAYTDTTDSIVPSSSKTQLKPYVKKSRKEYVNDGASKNLELLHCNVTSKNVLPVTEYNCV